jgi:hypothetical protein
MRADHIKVYPGILVSGQTSAAHQWSRDTHLASVARWDIPDEDCEREGRGAPGTAREPSNCAPFSCQGSLATLGGCATLDSGSFVAHLEVSAPGKVSGLHRTREGRSGPSRTYSGMASLVLPH